MQNVKQVLSSNKIEFNAFSSTLLMELFNKKELFLLFTNKHGNIVDACTNIINFTGYKLNELNKKNISDIFHQSFKNDIEQKLQSISDGTSISHIQYNLPLVLENGTTLWCKLFSTIINKQNNQDVLITHVIQNTDEHKKLKDDLSDTWALQKMVLNNIPDLIFVKDEDFKIVLCNDAFFNLYPPERKSNIIGKTTLGDYQPDEMYKFHAQDKIALKKGFSQVVEKITCPNGKVKTFETKKIRFNNSKEQTFILGISRDITENYDLIQSLKKTNDELNEFSYIAAHDLKSPMNAIRKIAGWLYEDCANQLEGSSLKYLELLMSRSERMLKLLDDLLDYSTIEKKDYPFNAIILDKAIKQLLESHDNQLKFKLVSDIQSVQVPNIPFKTIITNLVSNAIKHHPNQSPNILMTLTREEHIDRLIFEDNGSGIPSNLREEAIQVFKTLKPRDQVEGSGVGLSLIKKMTEHYSGHLSLMDSELGGLKVTLEWPINKFFIMEQK